MHFNDLFEETRRAKEHELKRAKERIDRLRHCASELRTVFGIDSLLEPIDTPTWSVEEIPDYVVTVKDEEVLEKQSRRGGPESVTVDKNRENKPKTGDSKDFYERILEKTMDGVLEPR